ncbi:MAG: nucleotide sugar dehydrogenase [Tissierellia bacterium]|mgnify:CR=1 FL=1|nr:nucleotide sugar dehydrogenase [Tissierellia bacterium]
MKKKITIVGLGYIGLPTAAIFAKSGMEVLGYDVNKKVIEALNKGKILIEEPGLEDLVKEVVEGGNLRGINIIEESDVFILAVPTPLNKDKTADLSYVRSATESIVDKIRPGNIVVLESTSPPGSTLEVASILGKSGYKIGEEIFVAHSPERVLPGRIVKEIVENDRIIGGINKESAELVKEVYSVFVKGEIFTTDSKTAEMCKLMENTFRDVNIALANELAILCENMEINAWDVIQLANRHPRVNIHQPGPGVGGHCIAVDPWFVIENQPEGRLIRQARQINDGMPERVLNRINSLIDDENAKITILGLTYKANVDDTRESPIIKLVELLQERTTYELSLHDPHVDRVNFKHKEILVENIDQAVENSQLIVLAVNHDMFNKLDFDKIGKLMNKKQIFDTRNFLDRNQLEKLDFNLITLGRN